MTTASRTPDEPVGVEGLLAEAAGHHGAGRLAEATAVYQRVLVLRPDLAEVHNNLGGLLAQQGKLDLAVARFQQALALRPNYAKAYNNLGNVLLRQGKLDEAAARFGQALAIRPDFAEAHNNLGNVLLRQEKLDEAAAHYGQALAIRPNFVEAHHNLGNVLRSQGKLDEAAAHYGQALAIRPDFAEAHNNLGNVLLHQGKRDEAAARYRQALAIRPDYAEAHNNLGIVLGQQDKLAEAAECLEQALALQPDFAEAHNNLGNTLKQQHKLGEAAARYQQALALQPDYAQAHGNLGAVLAQQGKLDEAAARYRQALALQPDYADAQFGLGTCYLAAGDYARGWPAYEHRPCALRPGPKHNLPRWTDQPLAGRRLLLVAEQGLGDTIHFLRYAKLLKARGARVVLAAPAALGRLLAAHPDLDELFLLGSDKPLPPCDFFLPLMSAAAALGTDASTIPRDVPYLWADPQLTEQWRQELSQVEGFRIGIVWQGSRAYVWDHWRSIALAQFAPLARVPGVRLISLQKGFGAEQIATVDFPVLDISGRLDETAGAFMDTAAVIRNLDLVVSPDTAIAHLAGALGAPVAIALSFSPDWRWGRQGEDSAWYPNARLFRQRSLGDWQDVFERIAQAVQRRQAQD
jgi:tetratricopeptide (TPR) repeat protein